MSLFVNQFMLRTSLFCSHFIQLNGVFEEEKEEEKEKKKTKISEGNFFWEYQIISWLSKGNWWTIGGQIYRVA